MATAVEELSKLIGEGFTPKGIDQLHDNMRLMGIVLAQMALIGVVSDPKADATAKVSAAKALLATKEDPASIAERLRRSVFAGLTPEQLGNLITEAQNGTDVQSLISKLKESPNGNARDRS